MVILLAPTNGIDSEIRNIIYKFAKEECSDEGQSDSRYFLNNSNGQSDSHPSTKPHIGRKFLALTQVNRKIRKEYQTIWARTSWVRIHENRLDDYFAAFNYRDPNIATSLVELYVTPSVDPYWEILEIDDRFFDITHIVKYSARFPNTDFMLIAAYPPGSNRDGVACDFCGLNVVQHIPDNWSIPRIVHPTVASNIPTDCFENHTQKREHWEVDDHWVTYYDENFFFLLNHLFKHRDQVWRSHVLQNIIDSVEIGYEFEADRRNLRIRYTDEGAQKTARLRRGERRANVWHSRYWEHFGFVTGPDEDGLYHGLLRDWIFKRPQFGIPGEVTFRVQVDNRTMAFACTGMDRQILEIEDGIDDMGRILEVMDQLLPGQWEEGGEIPSDTDSEISDDSYSWIYDDDPEDVTLYNENEEEPMTLSAKKKLWEEIRSKRAAKGKSGKVQKDSEESEVEEGDEVHEDSEGQETNEGSEVQEDSEEPEVDEDWDISEDSEEFDVDDDEDKYLEDSEASEVDEDE
jgi:hypothetical protein